MFINVDPQIINFHQMSTTNHQISLNFHQTSSNFIKVHQIFIKTRFHQKPTKTYLRGRCQVVPGISRTFPNYWLDNDSGCLAQGRRDMTRPRPIFIGFCGFPSETMVFINFHQISSKSSFSA